MRRAAVFLLAVVLVVSVALAEDAMIVTGGSLRLRTQPDYNAEVITRCKNGTVVTVTEDMGEWCAVRLPGGLTGYMAARYLIPADAHAQTAAQVICPNGGDVNLRAEPDSGAAILVTVPVGTQVSVMSHADGWHYITLPNGLSGYMMSRFLAAGSGGVRYVTSQNGGGVHLRTGPGQQYRSLGVLRVGTQVDLLESGSTWHRVSYGNTDGFMMARYLTPDMPQSAFVQLRSVRMSAQIPRVGTVLEAKVSPNAAQCLCIWSDDAGRLLGTGKQYQVKQDDVGQRIRVTVTGFGTTQGAAVSEESGIVQP